MKVTLTRGNKVYPKGKIMTDTQAKAKGILSSYYEVYNPPAVVGEFYTREEDELLVCAYVRNGGNCDVATDDFMANNNRHSLASIHAMVAGLRTLDKRFPNDTQWVYKKHLAEVATELFPNIFA